MTKQQANRAIAGILLEQIEKHPELRFGQLLLNLDMVKTKMVKEKGIDKPDGLIDEYYLEPDRLLIRVKEAVARLNQAK